MASIHQIRGAILEEVVAFLLRIVGYRLVHAGEPGVQNGHNGLEVQGRGCRHQIDNLASFDATPAFMYPLRLLLEAKCYENNKVGIDVVRNSVGVIKDISENYFSYKLGTSEDEIQIQRYNYVGAIFSTSGYTSVAQKYAIAHQVFLIDYKGIRVISPLIDLLFDLKPGHIRKEYIKKPSKIKEYVGSLLNNMPENGFDPFTGDGRAIINEINGVLQRIQGSYFGILQGRWPLHLLSRHPLPEITFRNTDLVSCRVYGFRSNVWSFSPVGYQEGEQGWFKLDFNLPEEIANMVAIFSEDPIQVANIKERHFSYIFLSGRIGGINRVVKLELDSEWIELYKEKMQRKARRGM